MSLLDLAKMAKKFNKFLIFDYRRPPIMNPYFQTYIKIIVDVLAVSKINPKQVFWISGPYYQYVLSTAPDYIQVYGDHVTSTIISNRQLSMLILEYNYITPTKVEEYLRNDNLSMILYSSSTKWTFSFCWCEEVYGVISDDPLLHANMIKPICLMNFNSYLLLCFCAFLLVSIFTIFLQKIYKKNCLLFNQNYE